MILKLLSIILLSTVKFALAFPLAYSYHLDFQTTIFCTIIGGIIGVIFFGFVSKEIIIFYNWINSNYFSKNPKIKKIISNLTIKRKSSHPKKQKKIFSKKTKRFIKIKQNYGLIGLAILTPVLISIPVGTFLAIRFFDRSFKTIMWIIGSIVFWSFAITSFLFYVKF